jgi:transcriptional regulator with XRE-family HTH domain
MSAPLDKSDKKLRDNIALRFKELRTQFSKSQTEVAHEAGKDKQNYNRQEKGRGASIYSINRFCNTIGISLSQFFDSPFFKEGKK